MRRFGMLHLLHHHHRYVEREQDKVRTMTYIKFVFERLECGHIKNVIINPDKEFKIEV